jgi:hypothetical protein
MVRPKAMNSCHMVKFGKQKRHQRKNGEIDDEGNARHGVFAPVIDRLVTSRVSLAVTFNFVGSCTLNCNLLLAYVFHVERLGCKRRIQVVLTLISNLLRVSRLSFPRRFAQAVGRRWFPVNLWR